MLTAAPYLITHIRFRKIYNLVTTFPWKGFTKDNILTTSLCIKRSSASIEDDICQVDVIGNITYTLYLQNLLILPLERSAINRLTAWWVSDPSPVFQQTDEAQLVYVYTIILFSAALPISGARCASKVLKGNHSDSCCVKMIFCFLKYEIISPNMYA